VLLGICAVCVAQPLYAQQPTSLRAPGPIAETAERIARERWPTDTAAFTIDEQGRPRFRGGVTEQLPPPPWQLTPEITPVPALGAISHQEMVAVMTPREFSAPAISPAGGGVDPGAIWHSIRGAWRDWQERRIHERVMREVEALRAASDDQTNEQAATDIPAP